MTTTERGLNAAGLSRVWGKIKALITPLQTAVEELDTNKAEIDGYYEGFTSGRALDLVASTVVEDKEPYNFRSLAHLNVGRFCQEAVVGGSVVWNQLVKNGNFADGATGWNAQGSTLSVSNNVATATCTGTNGYYIGTNCNTQAGHKYLVRATLQATEEHLYSSTIAFGWGTGQNVDIGVVPTTKTTYCKILAPSADGTRLSIYATALLNSTSGDSMKYSKINVIDLTAALTPTIADYIYSLEQTTAGAGVAWVRKYFPGIYYGYAEPHFEHVQTSAKETVGFNQWDEEWRNGYYDESTGAFISNSAYVANKNPIPALPNTAYYGKEADGYIDNFLCYDSEMNYLGIAVRGNTPVRTTLPNTAFIQFRTRQAYGTTYNHDICINIHGDRDGEYEPYKKRTYPLDSSLTLRGIPKLDSANRLYFDGDIYRHDGTVTRRYGIVDLGTLTWTVYSADRCIYRATVANLKTFLASQIANIVTPKYKTVSGTANWQNGDIATTSSSPGYVFICDTDYADVASFKTAMSGQMLVYELATPTTETAEPFQSPMVVDPLGTEEFVDYGVEHGDRDVAIPVGHDSTYPEDLVKKTEKMPSPTGTNGDYIVTEVDGKLYLKPYVPAVGLTAPTTEGEGE